MKKKTSLFEVKNTNSNKSINEMNIFEKEVFCEKHHTLSGNGANKLDTTGNKLLDDFANIGRYRNVREYDAVADTMQILWSVNPLVALKETVYLRTISRDAKFPDGTKLGKNLGQGLKSEFQNRIYWLAINHEDTFWKNLDVFVTAGSYDDLIDVMSIDLSFEHEQGKLHLLDFDKMFSYLNSKLELPSASLVKKYMPTMKASSKCTTLRSQCRNYIAKEWAKTLCKSANPSERSAYYRNVKSSGTAHMFQQAISQERYNDINFDTLPGRVFGNMIKNAPLYKRDYGHSDGKNFLERHNLVNKYESWLDSQEVVKYTGFVYELFGDGNFTKWQEKTLNKQFETLVKDAKVKSNMIVCVDSSGSMTANACGTNVSSYSVAKAMALYFSYMLKGRFENTFLEFASETVIRTWEGTTPCEKFKTPMSGYWGNTNVLSVAELFCDLKRKGYSEEEFPEGCLLISDGEFDRNYGHGFQTTFETFLNILREEFSEKFVQNFKLVLWDIPNNFYGREKPCFEGLANRPNFFYMSGFDPAAIQFLFGVEIKEKPAPKTAEELFNAAMDQKLLNMLVL